ncbi:hypothetical protein RFN29_15200 [Mesorhizobium sp. VK22B]|uniref:Uncharacterized protein n=1 Tax=Mesorhizobium captivum TaxID=3072319 RepID=A0ABU4Z4B5_9HYPH|nr:hypothetical protein [Mesorhizobium sp. VK22B]MDX8492924.1 hypothetical protein [Mesorhizobium sp. VK22B]
MTVPSDTNRSGPYNGNGVTTVFDYGFKITNENYIKVIKADAAGVETVLTIDADYVVSDVGNPAGGQVALTVALPVGQTLTMIPSVPFTQEIDLENQGAYYAQTVEDALDLSVMRDQQLQEQVNRAVTIPASEDPAQLDGLVGDILRLADSAGNIDIVANNIADVNTAADNMAAIIAAPAQAAAASASAAAADTSESFARKWATEAEDVAVNDGVNPAGFSAFHWMRKALGYASSASASAIAAAASAASIALPAIVASTFLQAKADASGYETKTPAEVRNALAAAAFVADRTAAKALDPSKDKAFTIYGEGGRNGRFIYVLTSSLSATEQGYAAADTSEGIYFTNGLYTAVRQDVVAMDVKWWGATGAPGNAAGADTAGVQAAYNAASLRPSATLVFSAGNFRCNQINCTQSGSYMEVTAKGGIISHDQVDAPLFRWAAAANGLNFHDLNIISTVARSGYVNAAFHFTVSCGGSTFENINYVGDTVPHSGSAFWTVLSATGACDTITFRNNVVRVSDMGYGIGYGSAVWFYGGRVLGLYNYPTWQAGPQTTGVQFFGGQGGVVNHGMDTIDCYRAWWQSEVNGQLNREFFITQGFMDGSYYGILIQDTQSYTNIVGCWAHSCHEACIYFDCSSDLATLTISGGIIGNAGVGGAVSGAASGLVKTAKGRIHLTGVTIRDNRYRGIDYRGNTSTFYDTIVDCKIYNNGAAIANSTQVALVGNVEFKRNSVRNPAGGAPNLVQDAATKTSMRIANNDGLSGFALVTDPAIGATGVAVTNNTGFDAMLYIAGGAVFECYVNGTIAYNFNGGAARGTLMVKAGDTFTIAYTTVPTIDFYYL